MTEKQRTALRSPHAIANAWEKRTLLVKQEQAAASAASDAKTARLKALRLERGRQQADAGQAAGQSAPARKRTKRVSA